MVKMIGSYEIKSLMSIIMVMVMIIKYTLNQW